MANCAKLIAEIVEKLKVRIAVLESIFVKYFRCLLSVLLLGATMMVGCEPDNVEQTEPRLEIAQELTSEALESLTLQFEAEAGSKTFAVRSNRAWTAVSSGADWCVVAPDEGDDDTMLTVAVSKNVGTTRRAEIVVLTLLSKRSVYVEQSGGQFDAKVIFSDNFDGEVALQNSHNEWPSATEFQKYNKKGTGAATVAYDAYCVTVRSDSRSNDTKYSTSAYSKSVASGVNNLYFEPEATFTVHKIALAGEQKLRLEWGVERCEYGNYDAPFNPVEFDVLLSADGVKWSRLTYTRSTYSAWDKASTDFQLNAPAEYLYIRMKASISTRIDDIKLTAGVGGQVVDLSAGEIDKESDEPATPDVPIVNTSDATDVSTNAATLGGSYDFDGAIAEAGVAYRAVGSADYTVERANVVQTPFAVTLSTLSAATDYEYYAYVVVNGKEYSGEVKTFATASETSAAVTYFADDFSSVENNKAYTSPKWTFTSTDSAWPAIVYLGWFGKTFDTEKYINIAPSNSQYSEVVAYAVMTKFNVADAESKMLCFDLAWLFKKKDNSRFEVVASKNYTGNVATATWEIVGSYTYTDEKLNPLNTWTSYSLDLSTKYAEEKALTVAFRYTGKMNTYRLDNVKFGVAPVEE